MVSQAVRSRGAAAAQFNQDIVELIDTQLATWDEHSMAAVGVDRRRPKGRSRPTAALSETAAGGTVALVAHSFELARLVRPVMPGGITHAYAPTVRAILEVAAVVHWLTTTPTAGEHWMEAIHKSRRNLRADMRRSAIWGQHASSIPDADGQVVKGRDDLLDKCKALPYDQHVVWRALSERAHPTATIAAFYVPDQGDGTVRFEPKPTAPADSVEFTGRIAWWLLWNHQAIDPYQGSPARQQLQRIDRQMHTLNVTH